MQDNPFVFTRVIRPNEFFGRERELQKLFSRLNTGQATAITGFPHSGKTSILTYVSDADVRRSRLGTKSEKDLVVMLDAQMLRGVKTQSEFWHQALLPLVERLEEIEIQKSEKIISVYAAAETNGFGLFVLEQFLRELFAAGFRLQLFLDEFDDFLSHPVLNSVEFFGGLRSLASRLDGFTLVIAIRHDLERLTNLTETLNPFGSPFFNIFSELKLGALTIKAFDDLLQSANEIFSSKDKSYIAAVSGRHPYLVQVIGAKLWEAHEEGKIGMERYQFAGRAMYSEIKPHFRDTWRSWSNAERRVVSAIALSQIPRLLENHEFLLEELVKDLADFEAELEALEGHGVVTIGDDGKWILTQVSFLWWLADEIRKNVRNDTDFSSWLKDQLLDGPISVKEKRLLKSAAKKVMDITGKGATSLIESFAKGFGQGVATASKT